MSPTATEAGEAALRLLAENAGPAASGILSVTSGKLKRLFCLAEGRLVFAASNLIEEQFPEILVCNKLLSPGHRAKAKVESARKKQKLVRYLYDERVVAPSTLMAALEEHVSTLLRTSLEATEGEASFSAGRPDLQGELLVDLSCVQLVLEHVRQHPQSIEEVRIRIGPPNLKPQPSERAAKILDDVALDDAARFLLDYCDGNRDVATLVNQSPVPGDDCLRALYGLILLGVLEGAAVTRTATGRAGGVTENEALGRLRTAEKADCYTILGVDRNAAAAEIRDSYYYLARRYHPDRFRAGPLANMLDKIEAYFTKVTEAYNTLIDPDRRAQYNTELASTAPKKTEPEVDSASLARQNFLRAKTLLAKNRFHDALKFLENAVQLDASRAEYHVELGRVLTRNPRRRADAEGHLRKAIEIDPASADGYFELGLFLRRTGRTEEAAESFRETLRWEQRHEGAREQLAELKKSGEGRRGGLFGG